MIAFCNVFTGDNNSSHTDTKQSIYTAENVHISVCICHHFTQYDAMLVLRWATRFCWECVVVVVSAVVAWHSALVLTRATSIIHLKCSSVALEVERLRRQNAPRTPEMHSSRLTRWRSRHFECVFLSHNERVGFVALRMRLHDELVSVCVYVWCVPQFRNNTAYIFIIHIYTRANFLYMLQAQVRLC